jgi:voltage-gated potassium channel
MKDETSTDTAGVTAWDLLLASLSVVALAGALAELLFELPDEISHVLHMGDTCLCVIFLYDFFRRLNQAPSKAAFMKWGWIDLLASLPSIDALRWGRVASLGRLLLILRAARSARVLWRVARGDPGKAIMALTMLATTLAIFGSSVLVLVVETAEKSNIRTGPEALWWSLTTVTTVGYGDHYPVTAKGRLVAAALMAVGITLYATFTAFISGKIMEISSRGKDAQNHADSTRVLEELQALREEVRALRRERATQPTGEADSP